MSGPESKIENPADGVGGAFRIGALCKESQGKHKPALPVVQFTTRELMFIFRRARFSGNGGHITIDLWDAEGDGGTFATFTAEQFMSQWTSADYRAPDGSKNWVRWTYEWIQQDGATWR